MPSSGVLRRVAIVRTDVSGERSAFIIKVIRIGQLGTTLTVDSNQRTMRRNIMLVIANFVPSSPILVILMMEGLRFSKTSVLTGTKSQGLLFFHMFLYVRHSYVDNIHSREELSFYAVRLHDD
jgi:hypothetical protein